MLMMLSLGRFWERIWLHLCSGAGEVFETFCAHRKTSFLHQMDQDLLSYCQAQL